MRDLKRRLEKLEAALIPATFKRWHRIIQEVGQTREHAIASYEAKNGPVGDGSIVIRLIVDPPRILSDATY